MSKFLTGQLGTLDLIDLNAISEYYGRDFLPYPFMLTQGPRFRTADEAAAYAAVVADRFNFGDLKMYQECALAYESADIRVECHVQFIPADTPSIRIVAFRRQHLGFLAAQRGSTDLVDIYNLSPYELGAAVAEAMPLGQGGLSPKIVIPEYVPRGQVEYAEDAVSIVHKMTTASHVEVAASEVEAYSTVQSHWRPVREWGLDRSKRALVWVRIRDDGDYVYAPDNTYAYPLVEAELRERIDQLISDDIAILREFRHE